MIYIFDVDGTITDRDSTELYPKVIAWLKNVTPYDRLFLATNQGGVGLRHWMIRDGFGDPSKLPTPEQARERINLIAKKMAFISGKDVTPYISFAYQSKTSGKWGPYPRLKYTKEWDIARRKPNSGMIQEIMSAVGKVYDVHDRRQFMMVGDMESDCQAAADAHIGFMWAREFFG